jgi:hypothetical protein
MEMTREGAIVRTWALTIFFVIAASALALTGCASPAVETKYVEVKIPVAVLKPEQIPALPSPLPPRPQSLSAAADLLLAKHCEFVAFAVRAMPLLQVSAGLPPSEAPHFPECGE